MKVKTKNRKSKSKNKIAMKIRQDMEKIAKIQQSKTYDAPLIITSSRNDDGCPLIQNRYCASTTME